MSRGRPRKVGPRYPSGKLKPQGHSVYWQRQIDELRRGELDPLLESQVGILLRWKQLTTKGMEAAVRFLDQRMAADRALGLPPRSPRAHDMNAVHGSSEASDDSDEIRKKRKAIEAYDRAEQYVGLGSNELAVLQSVVIYDQRPFKREQLLALYAALDKLLVHYGLGGAARPRSTD